MSYGYGFEFAPYVSVAEKKAKSAKLILKLKKKNKNINPVIIEGNKIAKQWWGKSWNDNLESYADYSNRIGRGRSYVRHGMVVDLQIEKGIITSLVAGTRSKPYKIEIKIDTLSRKQWNSIIKKTQGQVDSIQSLLEGSFPKEFISLFTKKGSGLFPSPKEIHFNCSCPDWAYMCKHVAATLFAIGARLDNNPELFFILRGVKMENLAGKVIKKETNKMLKAAKKKTKRRLSASDDSLSELFGVTIEQDLTKTEKTIKTKKVTKKAPVTKKASTKRAAKKTPAIKKVSTNKVTKKAPVANKASTKKTSKRAAKKAPTIKKKSTKIVTKKTPVIKKASTKKTAKKTPAIKKVSTKKVTKKAIVTKKVSTKKVAKKAPVTKKGSTKKI